MALSNILREPRREITESVIGLAIVGAVIWADYEFGAWLERAAGLTADGSAECPWPLGMVFGFLLGIFASFGFILAHGFGEAVCNMLERNGVRLRSRTRYR